jgi:glycosyltransferase involved in cell wall biosynthesis
MPPHVICAQIGARDHYAFPRAFQAGGHLGHLVTDYWYRPPLGLPRSLAPRIAGRKHPALPDHLVWSPNFSTLLRRLRYRKHPKWVRTIAMNEGFQKDVLRHLDQIVAHLPDPEKIVLFSYSYAAVDLFREAKRRGWMTILGQIDPGQEEDQLVQSLRHANPEWLCTRLAAPNAYFASWREECRLADRIIVNSEWSLSAMLHEGIPLQKLAHIPIPLDNVTPARKRVGVPTRFSTTRPLRILFLGQVNLRKGIHDLILAMRNLQNEPVELTVVGTSQITVPPHLKTLRSVRWFGGVPRSAVPHHFTQADVFILPTHSDGYGLTQLEALAHGIPVIASKNCARIVTDDVNGRILGEVTAEAIEGVIREILAEPPRLAAWTSRCEVPAAFQPESVARALNELLLI